MHEQAVLNLLSSFLGWFDVCFERFPVRVYVFSSLEQMNFIHMPISTYLMAQHIKYLANIMSPWVSTMFRDERC